MALQPRPGMTTPYLSGFSIIKNGIQLAYPMIESLSSLGELCDEVWIGVGFDDPEFSKDDGTWDKLHDHLTSKKFKFFKSFWDPQVRSQGLILSQQSNLALEKCQGKFCQYLQCDEVLHEKDFKVIQEDLKKLEKSSEIEGLIFQYLHFYGTPQIFKKTRNVYRREVRLIRNHSQIMSHLDAQGFRHGSGRKIRALSTNAKVYHYGWARPQELMNKKNKDFAKLYHGQGHEEADFQYQRIWGLHPFEGQHPRFVQPWVDENSTSLDIWSLPLKWERNTLGLMISDGIETLTGYRIGEYKNYQEIKGSL